MNLDEMIETLRNVREHMPGDTPVEVEVILDGGDYPDYKVQKEIHTVRFSPGQEGKPVVISESND
jgi:hypothetical protein